MLPHQQRVVSERDELGDRLGKLNVFLGGALFLTLPSDEQGRLHRQAGFMTAYRDVLNERIARFGG